ncbi:Uncharacterized protein DAT39_021591 [Clarias magur]|uniref:Uncharacterized protein n=1 Tax=Clarias magur TaxID=1594786 RepID=A0A8J4TCR4_CLAMG|nr:Uncharacterized protein DAT39_021591 [Clarias magur]
MAPSEKKNGPTPEPWGTSGMKRKKVGEEIFHKVLHLVPELEVSEPASGCESVAGALHFQHESALKSEPTAAGITRTFSERSVEPQALCNLELVIPPLFIIPQQELHLSSLVLLLMYPWGFPIKGLLLSNPTLLQVKLDFSL